MRKILCFILAIAMTMLLGVVSFATEDEGAPADTTTEAAPAVGTDTDDGATAAPVVDAAADTGDSGAPAVNVDSVTYKEPQIIITDGGKGKDASKNTDTGVLPKTGGIPAEVFYAAGAVLVAAALILSRKKAKPASRD